MKAWVKEHLPSTLASKRQLVFREPKTKTKAQNSATPETAAAKIISPGRSGYGSGIEDLAYHNALFLCALADAEQATGDTFFAAMAHWAIRELKRSREVSSKAFPALGSGEWSFKQKGILRIGPLLVSIRSRSRSRTHRNRIAVGHNGT